MDKTQLKLNARAKTLLYAIGLIPILAGIHLCAYWLRFEGDMPTWASSQLRLTLIWILAIKLATFTWLRVFAGWNRYLTFYDLVSLGQASTLSSLLILTLDFFFWSEHRIPSSIMLMDWAMTIVGIGGIRAALRWRDEHSDKWSSGTNRIRVMIAGANDAGEALLRVIRTNQNLPYQVVGFIAENQHVPQSVIGGVPVVGQWENAIEMAKRKSADQILVMGDLPGRRIRQLLEEGSEHGITVKMLPSFDQLIHGKVDLRPRRVAINDLLKREPVDLDQQGLHRWIDDRVLLVTGGAGSIGSEICRQLLQFTPRRLIVVDRSENGQFYLERELRQLAPHHDIEICIADVADQNRMEHLIGHHCPDIIFHAAAYKHVPMMEGNPSEAVKNIVKATRTIADLAERYDVTSFVMISTDKAVNPTNVMGACKRVAELYVQSLAQSAECNFVTVRFGNVLGSAGSVVPIFSKQIADGGPITVTHPDMRRYFMMIPEASQLVIQAGAMGKGGEIFVLDMGEPVRIYDLAQDMVRLSGLKLNEDIEIRFSGIRPGEKLYEELHCSGEQHLPTAHSKIMVANSQPQARMTIQRHVERLCNLSDLAPEQIMTELQNVVPQYSGDTSTHQREAA